jgi:3-oxoacyl-(acyl-carrier-protein) synthase
MSSPRDIVITGLGVVSPIGIGRQAFWESVLANRSGIRPLTSFDPHTAARMQPRPLPARLNRPHPRPMPPRLHPPQPPPRKPTF